MLFVTLRQFCKHATGAVCYRRSRAQAGRLGGLWKYATELLLLSSSRGRSSFMWSQGRLLRPPHCSRWRRCALCFAATDNRCTPVSISLSLCTMTLEVLLNLQENVVVFFLMVICEVDTPIIAAITQMLWSLGRRTDKQRWHWGPNQSCKRK